MQCGVASLAMATGFLGVPYGIDNLARICYVTREGVSMLTLSRAADRLGLKATTVKVTADRLRHLPMPAILHWNNNHFVLLYGITRKGNFRIADPAKGHMTLTEEELVSHWLRGNSDDVSLDIRPGKVTAIVGASGSGKTTLMKLMLGFYSPLAGKLEIEGKDLNDMDLPAWRKRCGVVMQNGVVFSDTIARNVAIADDSPDPGRLEEALRLANLLCFVRRLPLGAETVIGPDGLELSQGQKQRILIARAIYRDPEYIFLDEATNSLDAVNERGIVENMSEFGKGRTTVVIAHRLSTVNHADTIVVLEKGRVVETGDHAELIARRGTYYNLVKNQLELCD